MNEVAKDYIDRINYESIIDNSKNYYYTSVFDLYLKNFRDATLFNSSIQKLLSENLKEYKICYPHIGMSENAEKMLIIAQEQLSLWIQIITDLYEIENRLDFIEELMSKLKEKDIYFANYELLDKDIKKRELTFAGNSIKGILGYIQKKKENSNN